MSQSRLQDVWGWSQPQSHADLVSSPGFPGGNTHLPTIQHCWAQDGNTILCHSSPCHFTPRDALLQSARRGKGHVGTWTCPSWGPWEWDGTKLYATGPHLTQRLGGDGRKFADCYSEGKSTSRATKLCFQMIYVGIKGHFLVRSAVRICKWKERLETYLHFYEGMYQCLALLQSHIKLSLSNSSLMHHSQQWF